MILRDPSKKALKRAKFCGLKELSVVKYYKEVDSKSNIWYPTPDGRKLHDMSEGVKVTCPNNSEVIDIGLYKTQLQTTQDVLQRLAEQSCISCPFYGMSQKAVDTLLTEQSKARTERMLAEAEELKAKAIVAAARAELDRETSRILSQ